MRGRVFEEGVPSANQHGTTAWQERGTGVLKFQVVQATCYKSPTAIAASDAKDRSAAGQRPGDGVSEPGWLTALRPAVES